MAVCLDHNLIMIPIYVHFLIEGRFHVSTTLRFYAH